MENTTDKTEKEKDLECLIFENYLLTGILDDVTYSHDNENDIKREKELYLLNLVTDKAGELYRAFYGKEE